MATSRWRRRLRRRARRAVRRIAAFRLSWRSGILLGVGTLVVIAAVVFTVQAVGATSDLKEAEVQAGILKQKIVEGDVDGARQTLAELDRRTSSAADGTDGPLWAIAAHVPIVGGSVDAVRTVARETDRITDEALPGIVDVADSVQLETFRPTKGRVDLEAVAKAAPALTRADAVLRRAQDEVGAFDPESLLRPLREPMARLQEQVSASATATAAAHDAVRLLPDMLAADGKKRRYLLVILNNAEVRSIGGMPGSVAVLTTKNGKITMGRQASTTEVGILSKPAAKLTSDEKSVFSTTLTTDMRDTAIDPDFPRAAELMSAVVGQRFDSSFDGVIAVDPVALGYLLAGIGPVELPDDIRLTSDNAVSTLLNGVYVTYPVDNDKQDALFIGAARKIFDATVSGRGDSLTVIRAMVRAVTEGHLMMWSHDPAEQKLIANTEIAGALDRTPGDVPHVGVYVSDAGSAKMSYYLQMQTTVQSVECLDNGAQTLRTTTRLTSTAPLTAASLSPSVTGDGKFVPPGILALTVRTFAPENGEITELRVDGRLTAVSGGRLYDRPVSVEPVLIAPGQSVAIETAMRTAPGDDADPALDTTPGIAPNGDQAGPSSCD